jgi:hypothetical protein
LYYLVHFEVSGLANAAQHLSLNIKKIKKN